MRVLAEGISRVTLPLLEREAELAALRAFAEEARRGVGRVAVIEGGAGMGKTSLLAEVCGTAGLDVLRARGGELEGEFAFGIVRQLFEPVLAAASADERAELMAGAAELAAPLFAGASSIGSDVVGEALEASYAVLHGLYWLAANFALRRPTLVVVDDVHWADDPSLRWLVYLARRIEGLPLFVVAASRPSGQSRAPIFLAELLTDPAAAVIRPGLLGRASIATLSRARLGGEPDAAFVDAVLTASGGNPLYVAALLDAVALEELAPASIATRRTSTCAYAAGRRCAGPRCGSPRRRSHASTWQRSSLASMPSPPAAP